MKPVCMVIGAGAGIGGNVARRFAAEGYHAVLCRRTSEEGLRTLVDGIEAEGGSASGFLLDATEPKSIEDRIAAVESEIGPIEVLVFNLGFDRKGWPEHHWVYFPEPKYSFYRVESRCVPSVCWRHHTTLSKLIPCVLIKESGCKTCGSNNISEHSKTSIGIHY